jgi:hypothetical protein
VLEQYICCHAVVVGIIVAIDIAVDGGAVIGMIRNGRIHTFIYIYIYIYIYVLYIYVHAYVCVCMYVGTYVCMHACFGIITMHIFNDAAVKSSATAAARSPCTHGC